jgi:hypothetical protein
MTPTTPIRGLHDVTRIASGYGIPWQVALTPECFERCIRVGVFWSKEEDRLADVIYALAVALRSCRWCWRIYVPSGTRVPDVVKLRARREENNEEVRIIVDLEE